MATSPDEDAVTYLDANCSLVKDTDLFRGKLEPASTDIPHQCVFVVASGGPPPLSYMSSTIKFRYSAIQIFTRSNPRDYPAGLTLARLVRDTLHNAAVSGYVDVRCMESEPIYVEEDENGDHIWSSNFEFWHEQ